MTLTDPTLRDDPAAEELPAGARRALGRGRPPLATAATGLAGAYHRRLERVYRFLVPPGLAGAGDRLRHAATCWPPSQPAVGVGVDFSGEMVRRAAERHPGLRFLQADAHELADSDLGREPFDVIILSDLINDAWDVQRLLEPDRAAHPPPARG